MPIDMSCGQAMLPFVSNPLASLLFLGIFMSQACRFKIHVNTIMGDANLKHFSYSNLQHPSPKSLKRISLANNLRLFLIKRLPGAAHILAIGRLLLSFCIAFPDLLDSPTRDLHILSGLFCSQPLLLLLDNPVDLALVQFHNPCYWFMVKRVRNTFRTQ
jgi:hypothetical protein